MRESMSEAFILPGLDGLNAHNAKAALAQGVAAIKAGRAVFDLAPLKSVDSSAVAVLLAWQRAARAEGKTLQYANVPANLDTLARLYGIDGLLASAMAASPADLHHH